MKKEKNTSSKKTSTKKTITKKVESVEKPKESNIRTGNKKGQDPTSKQIVNLTDIRERIHSLEDAYVNAINGKIKFADVKDIFKKLHKEIKTATKK